MKIDLVYLWVDGNDCEFQCLKNSYSNDKTVQYLDSLNECRYRDNQELKYSLRSIAQNVPWINKIFIVTNGQVPKWLDVDNPKFRIVNHKEIMPEYALPVFNSEAIETCIANISDLSEYFLYANDDFFVNKPISPSYFFDKNNNPIVRLKTQKWTDEEIDKCLYMANITNVLKVARLKYGFEETVEPTHNIDAYRKSYFKDCVRTFQSEFNKVTYQRFRDENSAQRMLVSLYMIFEKGCSYKIFRNVFQKKEHLYVSGKYSKNLIHKLKRHKPVLFCVNDDQYTLFEDLAGIKPQLTELFPEKQVWEKDLDFQIEPINENAKTIVFAPDNNYFKYFAVALESLIQNSEEDEVYDIVVFDSDITDINKSLLSKMLPSNFTVRYFNMGEYLREYHSNIEFNQIKSWSVSMYYRCFIPFVMQKYEKVLYLDSDICVNENISQIFDIDFEGNQVLVVNDSVSIDLVKKKNRKLQMEKGLGLKAPETYFNSGVILFNIPAIDLKEHLDLIIGTLENKSLLYPDQDMLNIIFAEKKKLIPRKYNYEYGAILDRLYLSRLKENDKIEFLAARKNPVIIHYTSPIKPWNHPLEDLADVFWKYARLTPFYEIILFSNNKGVSYDMLKTVVCKKKIYFKYYILKIMELFTFGRYRLPVTQKRVSLKRRVKQIKALSKI